MTQSLLINQLFVIKQVIARKGKAEKKKRKTGPYLSFGSITLRQLHEILNSVITGKTRALNKYATMDHVIAFNTSSGTK